MRRLLPKMVRARERGFLLVGAFGLLAAAKAALRVFPFRLCLRWLQRLPCRKTRGHLSTSETAARTAWAVDRMSAYVPGSVTCLPRAMAAHVLLALQGCPSELRIGVGRGEAGAFEAHAWVESEGRVVVGGAESRGLFTPILAVEKTN